MYRYATLLTGWGPCLESFYETHKTAGRAAFEMACSFMQAIYDEFVYAPGATDIHTAAETAMAQGKGVCQDYTHIFLALCRKAGIPARYVAGMMIGEGATHAWAELYLDGVWRGFDPTHNRFVDDVYISWPTGGITGTAYWSGGLSGEMPYRSRKFMWCGGYNVIETVASVELPVEEHLLIQKNRIEPEIKTGKERESPS